MKYLDIAPLVVMELMRWGGERIDMILNDSFDLVLPRGIVGGGGDQTARNIRRNELVREITAPPSLAVIALVQVIMGQKNRERIGSPEQ